MAPTEQEDVALSDASDVPQTGLMSLIDHLQELRQRLIKIIISVAIAASGSYFFAADLVGLITKPVGTLYYMHPAEAFFTYMKVAFFVGFLLTLPITIYQAWAFALPALKTDEKKAVAFLVPASVLLFAMGLTFSYFLALPAGITFMLGFSNDNLQPLFSIGDYVSFVISFLLPFGFVFELPLIILVAAKFGLVGSAFLCAKRKSVFVLAFVLGAVLSPTPDVFSQTLVAVPLIILYELSYLIVRYILKR
jgi:sec-independent protein translocase protein TatC